jgi:1-acyl-sn-glycerol-3-phosphate acyltransferase
MSLLVYKTSRAILRCLFYLGGGLTVHGQENVPPAGPLIVAANHASHLDPMILGAAFDRPLHFMARRTLFDVPGFAQLIRWNNAFPLDRGGDSREALRVFGERLECGNAVVMFPEGTRSPDGVMGEMKPGVGMLAVRNAAPVTPVYIWGSYAGWPRGRRFPRPHRLKVYIAPAITPAADVSLRKDEQRRVTREVDAALRSMERRAWEGEGNPPEALLSQWRGGES